MELGRIKTNNKQEQVKPGKHGKRNYNGYSPLDHIKDSDGNNAQIKILEKELARREKEKKKEETVTPPEN